ncbi:uncharacterized protein B0J16DRAFT_394213 [Fusarium flagelliforme]|uniref:uncharacterized protein n=1 Tax=Fusarium flagelliforme TaxID=2675880 RepID=UPI001E8E8FA6|nr:uncharacterized protein B0J16DRAFT_394213 [Fusarium flagelliforme]KAH7192181.1 hypothetical protein B0J16DRAFT_394213 [Fusarium flagelliforme]
MSTNADMGTNNDNEEVPREESRQFSPNFQQPVFPLPPQPAHPFPYWPVWPYMPPSGFYHPHQAGYHAVPQAGYLHPQQSSFGSPQPPLLVTPQVRTQVQHGALSSQHRSHQEFALDEDVATTEHDDESQRPLKRSKSNSIRPESYPEKIVDLVSPQSNLEVSFQDVDRDEGVVDERPPKTVITTKELLTRGEKMRPLDLLKQYQEVMRVYGYSYSAEETYTEFFEKVFRRDWNTKWKSVNPLVFRPLRSSDTHIEIGYQEKDTPPSQSEDGRRRSRALKQTIPVFLALILEGGEINWKYHDKDGNRLRARDVTLHDGLSNLQAKKNALDHQDYQERKHIYKHNVDQIVQAARRRIIKWAAAGSDAQLGVDKDDRVDLETSQLPSERYITLCTEVFALRDYSIQQHENWG